MECIQLVHKGHNPAHNIISIKYQYLNVGFYCLDNFLIVSSAFQHERIIDLKRYFFLLKYVEKMIYLTMQFIKFILYNKYLFFDIIGLFCFQFKYYNQENKYYIISFFVLNYFNFSVNSMIIPFIN